MSQYNTALVEQMVAGGATASRETNDQLYPLVAVGDKDAIKSMIEGNMSLVISKVDIYIRCYPGAAYMRNDLISEGFLGLVTAVNRMAESGPSERPNATGYISYWIQHSIGVVMDHECANGAADRTKQLKRAQFDEGPKQVSLPDVVHDIVVDPTALLEMRDIVLSCCETEEDEIIVDMRIKGYFDKEIAAVIGAPVTTTYMLRRALYERFLEKTGMRGEV